MMFASNDLGVGSLGMETGHATLVLADGQLGVRPEDVGHVLRGGHRQRRQRRRREPRRFERAGRGWLGWALASGHRL